MNLKNSTLALFLSLLSILFLFFHPSPLTSKFFYKEAIVTKVIDGDTVEISNGEKIRLIGINAPEKGKYYFDESKKYLESLVLGKKVKIEVGEQKRDRYGRLLAYLFLEDNNINIEMIRNGAAHIYKQNEIKKYKNTFLEAEKYAIKSEIGIWKKSHYSKCLVIENFYISNKEILTLRNTCNSTLNFTNWYLEDEDHNILYFKNFSIKPYTKAKICINILESCDYTFYSSKSYNQKMSNTRFFLRDNNGLLVLYFPS